MVNDKKARLRIILRTDVIAGGLFMLPLIMAILPDSYFKITINNDLPLITWSLGLMAWSALIVWIVRLRGIKRVDVIVSVLLLASGLTCAIFILCLAFGLGIFSAGIAPLIVSYLSRFHVNKIKNFLE